MYPIKQTLQAKLSSCRSAVDGISDAMRVCVWYLRGNAVIRIISVHRTRGNRYSAGIIPAEYVPLKYHQKQSDVVPGYLINRVMYAVLCTLLNKAFQAKLSSCRSAWVASAMPCACVLYLYLWGSAVIRINSVLETNNVFLCPLS